MGAMIKPTVIWMGALRLVFGAINIAGAAIMIRGNDPAFGLRVNSAIAAIAQVIFIAVTLLGLSAIAAKLPPAKLAATAVGIVLLYWGTA